MSSGGSEIFSFRSVQFPDTSATSASTSASYVVYLTIKMPCRQARKRQAKTIQKAKTEEANKRLQEARIPHFCNPYDAEIIHLDHQSLGELHLNHSTRQTVRKIITSRLKKEYADGKFKWIRLNSDRHTLIKGFDDAIIAYRIPASSSK